MGQNCREIFSNRLRLAIEESSYSQRALAKEIGKHPSTIQDWVNGVSWPGFDVVDQLASLLNRDVTWFFGNDSTATPQDALAVISKALGSQLAPVHPTLGRITEKLSTLSPEALKRLEVAIDGMLSNLSEQPNTSKEAK